MYHATATALLGELESDSDALEVNLITLVNILFQLIYDLYCPANKKNNISSEHTVPMTVSLVFTQYLGDVLLFIDPANCQ